MPILMCNMLYKCIICYIRRALPRACQIISLFRIILNHLSNHISKLCFSCSIRLQFNFDSIIESISIPTRLRFDFGSISIRVARTLGSCSKSCSNNCFLFEKRAREASRPGASWHVDSSSFESGGAPFFEAFLDAPLFTQISHFGANSPPKLIPFAPSGICFLKKTTKTEKCVWTAQACTDSI